MSTHEQRRLCQAKLGRGVEQPADPAEDLGLARIERRRDFRANLAETAEAVGPADRRLLAAHGLSAERGLAALRPTVTVLAGRAEPKAAGDEGARFVDRVLGRVLIDRRADGDGVLDALVVSEVSGFSSDDNGPALRLLNSPGMTWRAYDVSISNETCVFSSGSS